MIVKKTYHFTTPFKDDIWTRRSKAANITKDDITSQHSDIKAMCCTAQVMSSILISGGAGEGWVRGGAVALGGHLQRQHFDQAEYFFLW